MKKQREDIVKAIRLAWLSLDSHLDDSVRPQLENECCNAAVGKPPFHIKCVREYAFIIKTLVDQL